MNKKKVIIVGAGISGLTAGIYALDNGFDVTIYEKHSISGGQCTSWKRDGILIDGCAHFIIGTNPKSDLYPLWRHIGLFDNTDVRYPVKYFTKFKYGDDVITIYADLDKLKEEFLRIAPEDKKQIKRMINGIKAYQHVQIPVKKPIDLMNIYEKTVYGIQFLPMLMHYLHYKHWTCEKYSKRFKNEKLRFVIKNILGHPSYNIHSFIYIMQSLTRFDCATFKGGSINMSKKVEASFISKGGKIIFNKEVKRIIVEDNNVKGIELKNNELKEADYVISALDIHHLFKDLLEDKYHDSYYEEKFENKEENPLNSGIMISYKISKDISYFPKMMVLQNKPYKLNNKEISFFSLRNHSYTKESEDEATYASILLNCDEDDYDYLKSLSKTDYKKKKEEIGNYFYQYVKDYFKLNDEDIKLIDVTTPLTYERYTNAYKGSYMSFITTNKSKGLMHAGKIRHIKNLIVAGQWIMPPGGLPIALFSGKHAAIRLCKLNKQKFINKEEYKYKFSFIRWQN